MIDTPDTISSGRIHRAWPHRLAIATACAVFPLVFVGAGVTSNDAGMAYPDWPTSGGHLVNPPSWWQQTDTLWEHGHRLLGWTVGMLAIVLACLSWREGGAFRTLGVGSLIAITLQGILGGLRVNMISTPLAMIHGIWGQVCFCVVAATVLVSSRTWTSQRRVESRSAPLLRRLCLAGTAAVFLQLVLGAAVRHMGGAPVLFFHLFVAVSLALLLGWIAMWVMGEFSGCPVLSRLGGALAILLVVQLLLGGGAFVVTVMGVSTSGFLAWFIPSGHVVVGALLLVSCAVLTLATFRILTPAPLTHERSDVALAARIS